MDEQMRDQILKDHFEWDKMLDERYHCKYCSYSSQLPNKAANHFAKRHQAELEQVKKSRSKTRSSPGKVEDQDDDHAAESESNNKD